MGKIDKKKIVKDVKKEKKDNLDSNIRKIIIETNGNDAWVSYAEVSGGLELAAILSKVIQNPAKRV